MRIHHNSPTLPSKNPTEHQGCAHPAEFPPDPCSTEGLGSVGLGSLGGPGEAPGALGAPRAPSAELGVTPEHWDPSGLSLLQDPGLGQDQSLKSPQKPPGKS